MSSSPYINHFLQPDTIIPGAANPQSWNRYSYVLNNPIRNIDPTGHKCVSEGEGDCTTADGKPQNGEGRMIITPHTNTPDNHPSKKPLERDYNFTVGYTYGGPADNVNPNYYGGGNKDSNVPCTSQFVPSQQNPNLCVPGPAAIWCS